jgi:alpha-tubulin suppressor-like RCC1 family protein
VVRGRVAAGALAVVVALLPSAPATADAAWPDGTGPDLFLVAAVGGASITAGKNHSCAITSIGTVYCWGDNSAGQLGDDNVPHDSLVAVPVSAAGDLAGPAIQVDAGDAHTCALDVDGIAYCWGRNGDGQLGTGSTTDAPAPAVVGSLTDRTLVKIATGAQHSCAIDDDGAAWCWGDNSVGQLGVPGLAPASTSPVRVSTVGGMTDPVVDIAAGGDTTCAVTDHGAAYCWGDGGAGQIGDGGGMHRDRPTAVATTGALHGRTIRQVAVGDAMACALDAGGRAYCWGDTAGAASRVSAAVTAPAVRFAQLAAGARHVCGLGREHTGYCWGSDVNGQLGDGSTRHADDPARVAAGARDPRAALRDVEAGARHSCAFDDRGVAFCWGADDEGQLGNGAGAAATVPVMVRGLPRPPIAVTGVRVTAVDGGLRVSWQPAADLGAGSFLTYVAATTFGAAHCTAATATATGCELRGLAAGRTYDVAVLTVTPVGQALSASVRGVAPASPSLTRSPAMLAPGGGNGLPATGASPAILVAAGCLMVGLGLAALLVRRSPRPPARRPGTARRPA